MPYGRRGVFALLSLALFRPAGLVIWRFNGDMQLARSDGRDRQAARAANQAMTPSLRSSVRTWIAERPAVRLPALT